MSNILDNKNESSEILQLVSFKIASEEYGIDILNVQEINKMTQITKVPNAPEFVEGVINLRGRVIPVIDLRTRLGLEKKEFDKDTRIIVVELNKSTVGFIVDAVSEVLRIPVNIIEAPPEIVSGLDSEFIKAVGKLEDRLLILIDLNKVLSANEKDRISQVA
jgi:purine-binding chemotaxis protein CheW